MAVALTYGFPCYTRMLIGRKAGLRDDWMAFVPFAWDVYRLRIVRAPNWHVFFFGMVGGACLAVVDVLLLLIAFSASLSFFGILAILVTLGYWVMNIYVSFLFYYKYYKGFRFNPNLAVLVFVPGGALIAKVIDVFLGFCNAFTWGRGKSRDIVEAATTPPPSYTPGHGSITALTGMYREAVFQLNHGEALALGRDPSLCQIVFDQLDTDISRKHCSISFDSMANQYLVMDSSRNGTYTNDGRKLQPGVNERLSPGTIIYLGTRKNIFRLG